MKIVLKFAKVLNTVSAVIVIAFVAIMSISVFYGVICRYLLKSAPFWTEEVSRFMMVWMAMIAAGIAFRHRQHVGLEFLMNRFCPPKIRKWVILFSDVLILIFFAFVIVYGVKFAVQGINIASPATGIRMVYPYSGIPVGGAFCFLQVLITLLEDITKPPAEVKA
jgi:TRAP-type C4-dicarboxylate transport system permease small subunit